MEVFQGFCWPGFIMICINWSNTSFKQAITQNHLTIGFFFFFLLFLHICISFLLTSTNNGNIFKKIAFLCPAVLFALYFFLRREKFWICFIFSGEIVANTALTSFFHLILNEMRNRTVHFFIQFLLNIVPVIQINNFRF